MKIRQISSKLYTWKRQGIWNGSHYYGDASLHVVKVETDEGLTGYGWNGGTAAVRPQQLLLPYVRHCNELARGLDPRDTRNVLAHLWQKQIKIFGPAGLHTQVVAAINIACWDIKGQAAGRSIAQLLGAQHATLPMYVAGGYYSQGKDHRALQEELLSHVENTGVKAVKMKVGDPASGIPGDLARIEAAREALGPDIDLLVDANCAFTLEEALALARDMEAFRVGWFEEPLFNYDYQGYRRLRESTSIPIATGENYYTLPEFERLITEAGADILNIDVAICPGYDVAAQVLSAAQKAPYKIGIAPHGAQELQIHLLAAAENPVYLEYYPQAVDPLRAALFLPFLEPDKNGNIEVPMRPGLGFVPNESLLRPHLLASSET